MQKLFRLAWVMCAFLVFTTVCAAGQDQATKAAQNEISMDLLMPVINGVMDLTQPAGNPQYLILVSPGFQRVLAEHFLLSVVTSFTYAHGDAGSGMGSGWYLTVNPWIAAEWHPFDAGMGGFLIGPALRLLALFNQSGAFGGEASAYAAGLGGVIGYRLLLPFNLDLYAVLAMAYGMATDPALTTGTRIDLGIGYRF